MTPDLLRLARSPPPPPAPSCSPQPAADRRRLEEGTRAQRSHHHYYDHYDREVVIVVRPARPVYYAPRPVMVYPAPVYAPPVAYAPMYGPVYPARWQSQHRHRTFRCAKRFLGSLPIQMGRWRTGPEGSSLSALRVSDPPSA